jgi:hypothetical protein
VHEEVSANNSVQGGRDDSTAFHFTSSTQSPALCVSYLRVLGKILEGGNVQAKLPALCELSYARPHVQKTLPTDGRCGLHERLADVIAPIPHESEAVPLVATIDHLLNILPYVLRQLQEQGLRFLLREGSHVVNVMEYVVRVTNSPDWQVDLSAVCWRPYKYQQW